MVVQYFGYERLLVGGLRSPEVTDRQRSVKRWLVFALIWQGIVFAGILIYVLVMTRTHRTDLSWVAPPLSALLGTALPYQLAVMRLTRAALRE